MWYNYLFTFSTNILIKIKFLLKNFKNLVRFWKHVTSSLGKKCKIFQTFLVQKWAQTQCQARRLPTFGHKLVVPGLLATVRQCYMPHLIVKLGCLTLIPRHSTLYKYFLLLYRKFTSFEFLFVVIGSRVSLHLYPRNFFIEIWGLS